MISYQVFFSPKNDTEESQLLAASHALIAELKTAEKLRSYRLVRMTDSTSLAELPRFQLIVNYHNQSELDASMSYMRSRIHEGPHGEILRLVGDFKVSFSTDV
jgi:hypothetical protein